MADSVYFREDPRQIANVASILQRERNSFSANLAGMKTKATGMKSFWKSDSADRYQKKASELDAKGQELIIALDGFVKSLQRASGIYETAENTAVRASQGLPTDGVYR